MQQSVREAPTAPSSGAVPVWRQVAWRTAVVLGLVALVKPATVAVAAATSVSLGSRLPLSIMLVVSVVWIVVVAARRRTPAVPTLVAAGLVQAVASIAVTWVVTTAFDGTRAAAALGSVELVDVFQILGAGALWGLVCGAVALALQNAHQGLRPSSGDPSTLTE